MENLNRNTSGNQLIQDTEARFLLASIIHSLQDSVVTVDLNGVITSWNRSAEAVYGYAAAEAIGRPLSMVTFPEEFAELLQKIEHIRQGGQVALYHTVRIHKSGQSMALEITLSPVKNNAGAVIGVSTIARDVTEIQQVREALTMSESRYQAIVEAPIDFGIILLDDAGYILDWNKGAEAIFGYTKEEVIGRYTDFIFTPEDQHARIHQLELDTARQKGRATDERWHVHKDGSRFFVSGVMTSIYHHTVTGFVKIARDITERKLAEEALVLAEQRKSLAVKSAEMGEWEWELATNTVVISDQVAVLLGLPLNTASITPGQFVRQIYPDDERVLREQLQAAYNGLHVLQTECRIVRADNGDVRWINLYGRVVKQNNSLPARMIGVVYDISPRKLLEIQRDDFISIASHELKTPVTAIKSYSDVLMENISRNDTALNTKLAERLTVQIDRLVKLIQNLLDFSHVSEGRLNLAMQSVDINKLIGENQDTLQQICSAHQLTFDLCPIPLMQADPQRVSQVIINLVSNAAKYSPNGTGITVITRDEGDKVRVSIADEGMGIPAEEQRFVFERYYRAKESPKEKGFGLGLHVCSHIIQQHGGVISVNSRQGHGSTFYFTLPYS